MIKKGFVKCDDKIPFFIIPDFEKTNLVKHCFTTRIGGLSTAPYDSMNLGKNTLDEYESVYQNYETIFNTLKVDLDKIVVSAQTHTDNIYCIEEDDPIIGKIKDTPLREIDGLITDVKGLTLVTYYADCTPLYFLDPKVEVIALAHSGWRGTVKKIGAKVIDILVNNYECKKDDILVAIGPCIGKCCYEVDNPVIENFRDTFGIGDYYTHTYRDKYQLDLTKANEKVLLDAGIPYNNITSANICTHCNHEYFYSYRRDKGRTGRMTAILSLK